MPIVLYELSDHGAKTTSLSVPMAESNLGLGIPPPKRLRVDSTASEGSG